MGDGQLPPGKYLVQVNKFADVSVPTKFQEEGDRKSRLFAFDLTDGEQKFRGIEYFWIKSLGGECWPGTKLLLHSTDALPLYVQNSHLMLTHDNVEVLGGEVERMVESWKASKEVEENRLLWKTEGIRKLDKGAESAPRWVDFDPKKAPRAPSAKSIEEERAQWQKASSTNTTRTKVADDEEHNSRFKVEEFGDSDATKVKSNVSSSAFKAAASTKGKGDKGKGKADNAEKGASKGARRGRGDDEGVEEKRAPVSTSLAAFIKPTKAGEMPDEALNLLTSAGDKDAEWDDYDWGESGWGESSWGESSWGQGWSSSGYGNRKGG
eukprot:CAMPEP_0169140896 /NCGR_PEP_ID=MMETSP1015-20121227/43922_1 /TAXON_ID=342587 /ORGANISM="Karlodinium micrum, Strain CCMP2283" /LENGTH=322 /DNA_ID=CAMNT_0009207049 /DNA_START=45 /DNA_END=1010 /DNA_ORIENTATION=-